MAYDRGYIEQALKANFIPDFDRYLEKIVQLEIKVPEISNELIKNIFVTEVKRQITLTPLGPTEKQNALLMMEGMILGNSLAGTNLKYAFSSNILMFFRNKRDIIRFTNSLVLRLSFYYQQVYVPDLFLVEMIRMFIPELHIRISFRGDNYSNKTDPTSGASILDLYPVGEPNFSDFANNPQLLTFIVRKYSDSPLIDTIRQVIQALISPPFNGDFNADHSIYYSDYYDSYFTLVVPSNVINLATVQSLVTTTTMPTTNP